MCLKNGLIILVSICIFSGCSVLKPAKTQMETAWLEKQEDNKKLLVFLPGLGDDLDSFRDNNIAELMTASCRDIDILYADAYFAYYRNRSLLRHLQEQVFQHAQGYQTVYVLGVSMGGLGSLLSAREFTDQVDGLILLAPFLGDRETLGDIAAAGGVGKWHPKNTDNEYGELWQWIQSQRKTALFAENTYLLSGHEDALHTGHQVVKSLVPSSNFVTVEGGHNWQVWHNALSVWLEQAPCPI